MIKSELKFKECFVDTINSLDYERIKKLILEIKQIKKKGRIFFLGVGGSAGNSSHAVNDFRKLCNIECYSPTDNVSEVTARTNDEGFKTIFLEYLVTKLTKNDAIFIFSVGGGNLKKVSVNLIEAIKFAIKKRAKIFSITAKSNGYSNKNSNINILVNIKNKKFVTPISESVQAYIWHLIVSSKELAENKTKW